MGKVFKALEKAASEEPSHTKEDHPVEQAPEKEPGDPGPEAARPPASQTRKRSRSLHPVPETSRWNERLACVINTHTPVAESFRRLRTRILHPPGGDRIKSVLVTSAVPEEGKSFICANLGVTLAQELEHQCLLIDCDLRRPSLAKLFGLENREGLVTLLKKGVDIDSLVRETGQPKLAILPSGQPPANPAELLAASDMTALLNREINRYDNRIILLDTPPMHAASETAVLAGQVDGVILVVRWGTAKKNQVEQVVESLGREKIIGIVFNAFEMSELEAKIKSYYYGSYFGYYSKYYYSSQEQKK